MQDIRISYTADTSGLKAAASGLDKLNAEERELLQNTNRAAAAGSKQGDAFASGAKKAQGGVSAMSGGLDKLTDKIAGAFAVGAVIAFGAKVLETTSEFQKLSAVLTNTLGSESAGQLAFAQIRSIAAKTNFSVLEITENFVKLANQGFKPTTAELGNLADLANSTGKSFGQLTDAVIDAQVGEFERLKEFGIRAEKQGDQVKFTFKGVETQVKNTSAALTGYIVGLGDLQGVSGSTAAISQTLGGQMSNLGDAFDKLLNSLGSAGSGGAASVIGALTGYLSELSDTIDALDTAISKSDGSLIDLVSEYQKAYAIGLATVAGTELGNEALERYAKANRRVQEQIKITTDLEVARLEAQAKFIDQLDKDAATQLAIELQIAKTKQQGIRDIDARRYAEALAGEKTNIAARAKENEEAAKKAAEALKRELAELDRIRQEYQAIVGQADEDSLSEREKLIAEFVGRAKTLQADGLRLGYNEGKISADVEKVLAVYQDKFRELQDKLGNIELITPDKKTEKELQKEAALRQKYRDDEIDKAGKALERQLEMQEAARERELERERDKQKIKQQIQQEAIGLGIDLANAFFEVNANNLNVELGQVRAAEASKLAIVGDNAQAQAFIKEETARKEREIQRRQAVNSRNAALFEVGVRTAMGVASVLSTGGGTYYADFGVSAGVLTALVLAQGALQAALILSKPLPAFRDGVIGLNGRGTETSDSILARLSKGESVMTARETKDYYPTLKAIRDGMVPPKLLNEVALGRIPDGRAVQSPEYRLLAVDLSAMTRKYDELLESSRQQVRELGKLQTVSISMDEKGFEKYVERGNARKQILNRHYPA